MKRSYYQMTAASALALSMAALGLHYAQASDRKPASSQVKITEQVSGAPSAKDEQRISQKGFEALNDAHLARMAINDGYVDNARKLLNDAKTLLERVKKEDKPVTVTTDVKVGKKEVEHERTTERADLIPVIADLQVVEGFEEDKPATAGTEPATKPDVKEAQTASSEKPSGDRTQARVEALAQAKEHLKQGNRQAAAEVLKPVDLTLVTRVINMPLTDTSTHVASALELLDDGKLHEANLELKKVQDDLVMTATVVREPTDAPVKGSAPEMAPKPDKAG